MSQHDQGSGWGPPPAPGGSAGAPAPDWSSSGAGGWPTPPPPAVANAAPVSSAVRNLGWVMLGLAVLVAIAAFLPWATFFGVTVSGIGGEDVGGAKDGVLTLILAIAAGVLGLLRGLGKAVLGAAIVAVVVGALVALIGAIDIADINDLGASVGAGLWLTLLGGLGLLGVGIAGIVRRR